MLSLCFFKLIWSPSSIRVRSLRSLVSPKDKLLGLKMWREVCKPENLLLNTNTPLKDECSHRHHKSTQTWAERAESGAAGGCCVSKPNTECLNSSQAWRGNRRANNAGPHGNRSSSSSERKKIELFRECTTTFNVLLHCVSNTGGGWSLVIRNSWCERTRVCSVQRTQTCRL